MTNDRQKNEKARTTRNQSLNTCANIIYSIYLFFMYFYLLQMEESSRDVLHSVHRVFWVYGLLTFHHHVLIEVQLPLYCWVI